MTIAGDSQHESLSSRAESAPPPGPPKEPRQSEVRYPALHVIRALMAVAVFASHWSVPRYAMLIPQKQLPVDLFFSVEGFLAGSLAFSPRHAFGRWRPVIHRFTAIYPLYLMGLIAGLFVMAPLALRLQGGWSPHLFEAAAVRGLFMLPTFSPATESAVYPFNSPSWAIVAETATFAVFWPLRARLNVWILALVTLVAMALMLGLVIHWHDINLGWQAPGYWGGLPRVAFGFLSGALLFRIMQSTGPILPRPNPVIIFLLAGAILFLKVHLIGLPLLLVIVPLLTWTGAISAQSKWLAGMGYRAGRHAYAIYLLAFPTVLAYREIGASLRVSDAWLSGPASFPVLFSIVLLVAHAGTIADEHIRRVCGWTSENTAMP